MLRVENLHIRRGDKTVLADINLHLNPGEVLGVLGPNGAGKSTLLGALCGELKPDQGKVWLDQDELAHWPGMQRAQRLAVLPQASTLEFAFRVEEVVGMGRLPHHSGRVRDDEIIEAALAAADVGHLHGRSYLALSGGERQRVHLARVLAQLWPGEAGQTLLLDEPTSMLDADHAASVRDAVARTVDDRRATLVVVEHRLERWLDLVDRVVVLGSDGTVIADADPQRFVRDHRDSLGRAGVWMPGLPAPTPVAIDPSQATPHRTVEPIMWSDLTVDLRSRSMRGTTITRALDGVGARLDPGRLAALTGPSGAGKSTLLAAFGGLVKPVGGVVTGPEPALLDRRTRALAADVGWVPQVPEHGFVATTVRAEVEATPSRLDRAVDTDAVLDLLGLTHLAGAHPYRLSGGEQRRLSLATAIAHRPGLVLLDEPTVGQDRLTWAAVAGLATAVAAAGAIVATSTHDVDLVALADDRVDLRAGVRT